MIAETEQNIQVFPYNFIVAEVFLFCWLRRNISIYECNICIKPGTQVAVNFQQLVFQAYTVHMITYTYFCHPGYTRFATFGGNSATIYFRLVSDKGHIQSHYLVAHGSDCDLRKKLVKELFLGGSCRDGRKRLIAMVIVSPLRIGLI